MKKIKLLKPLTEEAKQKLERIIKSCNSKNGAQYGDWKKTRKICNIILSVNEGNTAEDVARKYNVGRTTVFNYINKYNENPNFMLHQQKKVSELEQYEFDIASILRKVHVSTYKDVYKLIKKKININISYQRTIVFLKNHDFIKDKNKGYIIHKKSNAATIRRQKYKYTNKQNKEDKKSYLIEHSGEIEKYIYSIADACNYDTAAIVERVKEKFNLKEEKEVIKNWIEKNTSL